MWWSCFSYDKKGPFHIWQPETAAEKNFAKTEMEKMNRALESKAKEDWEMATAMRRMNLTRPEKPPGRASTWKFNEANEAVIRKKGKSGIDWWRYQQHILKAKLIPFAQKCAQSRSDTVVQEDGAPSHISKHQQQIFMDAGVLCLIWPGNSPDPNPIEPCWPWMKRQTTKKGAPCNCITASKAWTKAWKDLEQWQIQRWIERIPRHIQRIIELEGGNEYQEGCMDGDSHP